MRYMSKEFEERKIEVFEGILSELAQIRVLLERDKLNTKLKVEQVIKSEPSFDDFLVFFKGYKFHKMSVGEVYKMYTDFCPMGKHEPVTKNKFSRLMHSIGYATKLENNEDNIRRVFVNSEPFSQG